MKKKFQERKENPDTKPDPHKPDVSISMDSRDSHGLSKDDALQAKK